MLQKLTLHDYALVDRVELDLGEGLNVFTGETGAGKSILVGAIAALLGEKAAYNILREEGKKAVLEGIFVHCRHPEIFTLLQQQGIELGADQALLLRREFHATGRSRTFVNDTPVPATVLDELAEHLADLHGQHEHQSLLRPRTHVQYLDTFAGLLPLQAEVAAAYEEVVALRQRHEHLARQHAESQSRRELELFQLQEIKLVGPQAGEEEALAEESKLLGNAERRAELTGKICLLLSDSEQAVQVQLKAALEALEQLAQLDGQLQPLLHECRSAEIVLRESAQELQRYPGTIELDESRLEQVRQRLADLQKLKRKYGGTLAEVLQRQQELEAALQRFENFATEMAGLAQQLQRAQEKCAALSLELSERRRGAARQLEELVPTVLAELGLASVRFQVNLSHQVQEDGFIVAGGGRVKAGRNGIDVVEFFISTNPGVELAPLTRVASGGEVSRIMLALKAMVAERDQIPVLVFDEIDNGVSGRVAQAVGRRLQKLGESHQIICITHLPQIASAGRHHFLVEKTVRKGRSQTGVRRLSPAERPHAIARLLGGEKISEAHLRSAQELLAESGNAV